MVSSPRALENQFTCVGLEKIKWKYNQNQLYCPLRTKQKPLKAKLCGLATFVSSFHFLIVLALIRF